MGETYDIAIIGAGPAGCACAVGAARRGLGVALFERQRFPRDKACGGCIGASGVRLLDELGLSPALDRATRAHTTALRIASPAASVRLPHAGGRIVDRTSFDHELLGLARDAGVDVFERRRVGRIASSRDGVRLFTDREVAARVAVLACGLGRAPEGAGIPERVARRSYIGVGAHVRDTSRSFEPGVTHMHTSTAGYVGVVRLDRETLDVAMAIDPRVTRDRGVSAFVAGVLTSTGSPVPAGLDGARWKGTPALTRAPRSVARGRVLLAGDAAGYVEPFTGEGMTWAAASGALASECAAAWLAGTSPDLARTYAYAYRRRVARRRQACRAVRAALRCPTLVNATIRVASSSSTLSRLTLGVFDRRYRVPGATS